MANVLVVIASGDRHTQSLLAAEALRQTATRLGHSIDIEIQSVQGVNQTLSSATIQQAKAILLVGGVDTTADTRFAGLRQVQLNLDDVLNDAEKAIAQVTGLPTPNQPVTPLKIVAITSCPTGIAHTFMAAEGLAQAAKALGHTIRVETQGSVGAQDTLTTNEISQADLVIISADTNVDLDRFQGKRVFKSATKPAINDGENLVLTAVKDAKVYSHATTRQADQGSAGKAEQTEQRNGPYKHLMTGVSFMLPFVTTGGILIALAFALGGIYAFDDAHKGTLAWALFQIGAKSAFALMVPILSGYIAFSIANRPGLAPGMVGGMLANSLGAGFLGGIVAGFIAGYGTDFLNKNIKLHRNLEGLKPVLILPILGSLLVGLLMIYVVGDPVAGALAHLTDWLKGLQNSSAVVLGLIIGAMMAFDMGGPVNKAAYAFSTGLLASHVDMPMAAAMAAGMTPPLGIALATKLFKDRFTSDERQAGNAAFFLGLSFISEGAIPFAARDPFRVIPALMIGSAAAGAIAMFNKVEQTVPHGGIFVLPIPNAVVHVGWYLVALIVGTLLTAIALRLFKQPVVQA